MELQKNVLLDKYTTMRIPGKADYFLRAKNEEELIRAVSFSKEKGLPFFILGAGSNTVPAKRYGGVVIKMDMKECSIEEDRSGFTVFADAGVSLVWLSRELTNKGAVSIEWGAGVPGTVGGAIYGNAGAFERSMAELVTNVIAIDTENIEELQLTNEECRFAYRDSVFKRKGNLVIISSEMRVPKGEGGADRMAELLALRRENHPSEPSAGSVFKNTGDVSSAYLIEQCGLKGKKKGGAQISEKHANFIINTGGATREDVEHLIDLAKKEVKKRFGVEIEEEVDLMMK